MKCPYCDIEISANSLCKHIKRIELDNNGLVSAIEFKDEEFVISNPVYIPVPYPQPYPVYPTYPTYPKWVGPTWIYSGTTGWTINSPNTSTYFTVTT